MKELVIKYLNRLMLTPSKAVIKSLITTGRCPKAVMSLSLRALKQSFWVSPLIHKIKKRTIKCAPKVITFCGNKAMNNDYELEKLANQEEISYEEIIGILEREKGLFGNFKDRNDFFLNNLFNFIYNLGVYHG